MRSTTVRAYGDTPAELESDALAQARTRLAGLDIEASNYYTVYALSDVRTSWFDSSAIIAEGTRRGKKLYASVTVLETSPGRPGRGAFAKPCNTYTCARCKQEVPVTHNHSCGQNYSSTSLPARAK